jgi:hypothetical protein
LGVEPKPVDGRIACGALVGCFALLTIGIVVDGR